MNRHAQQPYSGDLVGWEERGEVGEVGEVGYEPLAERERGEGVGEGGEGVGGGR